MTRFPAASAIGGGVSALSVLVVLLSGTATAALLAATGLLAPVLPVPLSSTPLSVPAAVVALVVVLLVLVVLWVLTHIGVPAVLDRWRAVSPWGRATLVGFVLALVLTALLVVGLPTRSLRMSLGPAGFLAAWPLCTTGLVLRARHSTASEGSRVRSALVGVGYAQLRGPERRTLAAFVGGIAAVPTGFAAAFLCQSLTGGVNTPAVVAVGLAVWVGGTVLAYGRYAATERTDLTVLDIRRTAEAGREMSIRNDSNRVIDLTDGTVRDTEHARFRVGSDRRLGPGDSCTLAVPEAFSLAPADVAVDLPLGYTLERGSDFPVVFGRTGERFRLRPDPESTPDRPSDPPEEVDGV